MSELWDWVVRQHDTPVSSGFRIGSEPQPKNGKPVWNSEALWIAQQLAQGHVQIVVPRRQVSTPDGRTVPQDDFHYAMVIQRLAKAYPMVYFVPEDSESANRGTTVIQQCIDSQLEQLGRIAPNVLPTKTESLHAALNAYIKHIPTESVEPTNDGPQLTGAGILRIEHAKRLKLHHEDRPLQSLDFDGCQLLIDYWRNRPLAKSRNGRAAKPMSSHYCKHHVDELKRFFRWLSKHKKFDWRKPDDYEDLKCGVRDLSEERTDISFTQVTTYTPDELALIYQFGSNLERLLLLLGLNFGFRGSEAGTLDERHLCLDAPHPNLDYLVKIGKFRPKPDEHFVLYSRHKSKVYGEFLVWPETERAIRWALRRKQLICKKLQLELSVLLITKSGQPFCRRTSGNKNVSQIFNNKWLKLTNRIRVTHPEFRRLPFGTLRDTATDLVRQCAGGEAANVFVMHGTPTKDNLLELYSNRPFQKVFEALRNIRKQLDPIFMGAKNAFEEEPAGINVSDD